MPLTMTELGTDMSGKMPVEPKDSKKMYWVGTEGCNAGCVYCYYNTGLEVRQKKQGTFFGTKTTICRPAKASFGG